MATLYKVYLPADKWAKLAKSDKKIAEAVEKYQPDLAVEIGLVDPAKKAKDEEKVELK